MICSRLFLHILIWTPPQQSLRNRYFLSNDYNRCRSHIQYDRLPKSFQASCSMLYSLDLLPREQTWWSRLKGTSKFISGFCKSGCQAFRQRMHIAIVVLFFLSTRCDGKCSRGDNEKGWKSLKRGSFHVLYELERAANIAKNNSCHKKNGKSWVGW